MVEYHPLRSEDHNPTTAEYARLNNDAEIRASARKCRSAKMPCLSHLCRRDYDVYEPSDDTYLLIDAIGMDVDAMMMMMEEEEEGEGKKRRRDDHRRRRREQRGIDHPDDIEITLEIGCGTGVPTVYLATRLRDAAGTDDHRVVTKKEDDDATDDDANDDDINIVVAEKTFE